MRRAVAEHDVGLVVDPLDTDAIADAVRRALGDAEAQQRWRANIPAVFETYSPEVSKGRFQQVYRDLLAG